MRGLMPQSCPGFFPSLLSQLFFSILQSLVYCLPLQPINTHIFSFLTGGGGGGRAWPADFGELSGADMQAGLHFSLGGGEWKPNCQEYLFHDPQPTEQASKRTFSCNMCCAAGVLRTGSVAQESGKGDHR